MLPAIGSQESNLGDPGGCGPLCSPSTRITSVMMIQLRVFRSAFHCGGGSRGKEQAGSWVQCGGGVGWGLHHRQGIKIPVVPLPTGSHSGGTRKCLEHHPQAILILTPGFALGHPFCI